MAFTTLISREDGRAKSLRATEMALRTPTMSFAEIILRDSIPVLTDFNFTSGS
jgi:hypothetical protein